MSGLSWRTPDTYQPVGLRWGTATSTPTRLGTTSLADTLVDDYDVIDFLHRLTERCVSVLGVSEAGVALTINGRPLAALASSSERMRLMELIEVQAQDGPCLDSFHSGDVTREDDLEAHVDRWPQFGPTALAAGFRSVYAVPMRLRDERIGALNLFADHPAGLHHDDERLAQALADVATIGILHERFLRHQQSLSDQLQVALDSRIILEQAKGVVAEQAGFAVDDAFRLLRSFARGHNRRLVAVAEDIVSGELTAAA